MAHLAPRLALPAAAAALILVLSLAPLPHLALNAVAVAARVAVFEVVGGRPVLIEEQLLQDRAVGGAVRLADRKTGPARRLERLKLVLRRGGASSG